MDNPALLGGMFEMLAVGNGLVDQPSNSGDISSVLKKVCLFNKYYIALVKNTSRLPITLKKIAF